MARISSLSPSWRNFYRAYQLADPYDRRQGLDAYTHYNRVISVVQSRYSTYSTSPPAPTLSPCTLPIACGAFAALSPNNDYLGNLRDLETLLDAFYHGRDLESFRVTTYCPNKLKAWRICQGEDPLTVLPAGKKTWHFYQNILDPANPTPITIDGHMFSVWNWKRFRMSEAKLTPALYNDIAYDLRRAADHLALIPNQLQAICWYTWKRIHKIRYDGDQLMLWNELGMVGMVGA